MPGTNSKPADADVRIESAIEAFLAGVAFTRCFTYPYIGERIGPLWVMRDAPRKQAKEYRREEWVAYQRDVADVDRIIKQHTRGRYCICAIRTIDQPDAPIRAAYKSAGYRLGSTEAIMVHALQRIPRVPEPFPVQRITNQEMADVLHKTIGRRQVLEDHFAIDSPLRQYAVFDAGKPIGWARSIVTGNSTWVSNVHVIPSHRRRGIGRSILARMLRDDRKHGSRQSVLTASHTGAMLYPTVGYELIGQLLLYTPKRR
jgi:GNAT superfamily N-acetyltransferase